MAETEKLNSRLRPRAFLLPASVCIGGKCMFAAVTCSMIRQSYETTNASAFLHFNTILQFPTSQY